MTVVWRILFIVTIASLFVSCKKDDPPVAVVRYLFATPNSVTLSIGSDTTVTLSGGTPPYVIVRDPKVNVASATLDAATVTIHGNGTGGSTVTVGDNAAIQNTVGISIVVTALYQ